MYAPTDWDLDYHLDGLTEIQKERGLPEPVTIRHVSGGGFITVFDDEQSGGDARAYQHISNHSLAICYDRWDGFFY
ncbi:hypothetical protein MKK50_16225 [Methylobacterium sp. J-043]|nr:hypothetical protein [Methylobacterium sp. J-043]